MKHIRLRRYGSIPGEGTFGKLTVWDGAKLLYTCRTVEKEWLDNKPYKSCIPAPGTYLLELGMYFGGDGEGGKRDYPAYIVLDVPDRTLIKIHIANRPTELLGCIALGSDFATMTGEWAVKNSTLAFERFMKVMDGDKDAKLTIEWIHL
jgi:hypothetical protein